jgi:hypothetical protein
MIIVSAVAVTMSLAADALRIGNSLGIGWKQAIGAEAASPA